jgi:alpha-tubulin suppressor-like RCC1 family protein
LSKDEILSTYPKVIPFFGQKKIKYCDGGVSHSVAIDYDHNIYTFGANGTAQLGRFGNDTIGIVDGSNLEDGEVFEEVHTNLETNYALTSRGRLFVWGSCSDGACPEL